MSEDEKPPAKPPVVPVKTNPPAAIIAGQATTDYINKLTAEVKAIRDETRLIVDNAAGDTKKILNKKTKKKLVKVKTKLGALESLLGGGLGEFAKLMEQLKGAVDERGNITMPYRVLLWLLLAMGTICYTLGVYSVF